MAVRIRLKKMGRRHRPFFRVCAMDSRSPRDGRVIEELGTYDPMVRETDARAILNGERIEHWLSVGAKATPKVAVLIKKYGKEGSHLNEQQSALSKLAAKRGDAIASATASAVQAADEAKKIAAKAAEEKAAAEKEAEAAAQKEAEAAAAEETSAEATADDAAEPAEASDDAKAEEATEAKAEDTTEEKTEEASE